MGSLVNSAVLVDTLNSSVSVSGIDSNLKIYDVNFNINFSSRTEIDISFVNKDGNYIKPTLDSETPQTLKIGERSIVVYPISCKIVRRGTKLMSVRYGDSGIKYLDKHIVAFKNISGPRIINIADVILPSSEQADGLKASGYKLSDLLAGIRSKGIPISDKAAGLLDNSNNFLSDVEYQKVFIMTEIGKLRDILSSYGAKIGCVFYWDILSEKLDAVTISDGTTKRVIDDLNNELVNDYDNVTIESSESSSISESISRSGIIYDIHSDKNSGVTFMPFDRVQSEKYENIDWIANLKGVPGIQNINHQTFLIEERGVSDKGFSISPNQVIGYENSLIKLVYASQMQILQEYIFAVLLKNAIKQNNITPISGNARVGISGDKPDITLPSTFDGLEGNSGIEKAFGKIQILDYVPSTENAKQHYDELIRKKQYSTAEIFKTITGYNTTTETGDGVLAKKNGYFICWIENDKAPKSDLMNRVEQWISPLSSTYGSLYVSAMKCTKSSLAKFSHCDEKWTWSNESVMNTPLKSLAVAKFGDLKELYSIAFDPFYDTFKYNQKSSDIPVKDNDPSASGRIILDLGNTQKSAFKNSDPCFLITVDNKFGFEAANFAISTISQSEKSRFTIGIIFEDAISKVLKTVNDSYLNIVPRNKISRKFVLNSNTAGFINLDYKYRIANLNNPSCISNTLQVIKAPTLQDVLPVEDLASVQPFTAKIDLDYVLQFLEAQGAFNALPESTSYSMTIADIVSLEEDWLQRGLEGYSISIGSDGLTTNITISDRKKLFQNLDEISRLIADNSSEFTPVHKLHASTNLLSPIIQNGMFS